MVTVRVASQKDLRALSERLLALIEDKNGQAFKENVARFGIPDEYVKRAFSEATLVEAARLGNAKVYLALEEDTIIGFAQMVGQQEHSVELDRLIVFPEHAQKGVGTQLLHEALEDQRLDGTRSIIVNAGKQEEHARRFYEKNGFKPTKETTIDAPWGQKLTLVTYRLSLE